MAIHKKSVCIIGAGPSGLVAAKTLVHDHPENTFHVTVFEQSHRIGGLWPTSVKDDEGLVDPHMNTNQSRHTVSFSDLAWPESSPPFPKAWQVGQYLQKYIEKYPGYDVRTGCKVVAVDPLSDGKTGHPTKWQVQIHENQTQDPSHSPLDSGSSPNVYEFDHIVVATGFFGKPQIPDMLKCFATPVWHSSQVRQVYDLLTDNGKCSPGRGRRIIVIGGQMSGVEIASSVALQLSSAANSPGTSPIPNAKDYSVHHVVQNPFWVMPLYFPNNPFLEAPPDRTGDKVPNPAPAFLPLDLVSYNIGWRPPGPLENSSGHISHERANITHNFMTNYIGSDQSELGIPELSMTGEVRSNPPWLTVSDNYTEFVRSGNIKVAKGKVIGHLESSSADDNKTLIVEDDGKLYHIEDIAAVILATGFKSSSSLDIFPPNVLEGLGFDSSNEKFPLALNIHSSINKSIPSLGFVGFYRSQYWGVMEMQARFLGKLWCGDTSAAKALADDKTVEQLVKLRNDPRCAQFPMGDYAYLMESFSEILGIKRAEPRQGRTGIVLPPRYLYDTATEIEREQAAYALAVIDKTFSDSAQRGKFVARAVFRAMQGEWKLERSILSRLKSYPSGTLLGKARFMPRFPTSNEYDMEHLYFEEGEFTTNDGIKFQARRSYAHRYCEATDRLSMWFTKEDSKTIDYLFHELEFLPPGGSSGWKAKSSHLCIADTYDVEYEFKFRGVSLLEWTQKYRVAGPSKDYSIKNVYRR